MKRYNIYIILIFVLCACQQDLTKHYQSLIVGEWEAIDENNMTTFIFDDNEICMREPGFFEYIDPEKPTVSNPSELKDNNEMDIANAFKNIMRFYRKNTSYKIEHNCLKIYDPALKDWSEYIIDFLSQDTLMLSDKRNAEPDFFIRKAKQSTTEELLFDQIVIYCPPTPFQSHRYYSFFRNGQMVIFGNNGLPNNCTLAAIDQKDFMRLENSFKRANIQQYLQQLSTRDLETYSPDMPGILFVQGNKIYSFCNDFHKIGPSDFKTFYQAYFTASFYSANLHFSPDARLSIEDLLSEIVDLRLWGLYAGDEEIILTEAERFYLITLLRTAPKTNERFQPKYLFKIRNSQDTKIQTDGQLFTFWVPAGKRTVDIGFNFIEEYIVKNNP